MSKFNSFVIDDLKNQEDMSRLIEVAMFLVETPYITEGEKIENAIDMVKKFIPKLGISVTPGKGLIYMLLKSSKNMGMVMYHAFQAYYNHDENHKAKLKELLKSIKKEDFLDFLLKLDMITFHAVSGPVHVITAITGWKIGVLDKNKEEIENKIKTAISSLETLAVSVGADIKKTIVNYINALKRLFDAGGFLKVGRDI